MIELTFGLILWAFVIGFWGLLSWLFFHSTILSFVRVVSLFTKDNYWLSRIVIDITGYSAFFAIMYFLHLK